MAECNQNSGQLVRSTGHTKTCCRQSNVPRRDPRLTYNYYDESIINRASLYVMAQEYRWQMERNYPTFTDLDEFRRSVENPITTNLKAFATSISINDTLEIRNSSMMRYQAERMVETPGVPPEGTQWMEEFQETNNYMMVLRERTELKMQRATPVSVNQQRTVPWLPLPLLRPPSATRQLPRMVSKPIPAFSQTRLEQEYRLFNMGVSPQQQTTERNVDRQKQQQMVLFNELTNSRPTLMVCSLDQEVMPLEEYAMLNCIRHLHLK